MASMLLINAAWGWLLPVISSAVLNGGLKYPSIAEQAGDVYFMSKNVTKAMDMWRLAKSMGVNSLLLDKKIASKIYIQ